MNKKEIKKKNKEKVKLLKKARGLRNPEPIPSPKIIKNKKKEKQENKTWNEVIQELFGKPQDFN